LCRLAGISSVTTERKARYKTALSLVHDDLAKRVFIASGSSECWLTDITEHWTAREGKLYLCAIKDVWSNRIVRVAIDDRMRALLAVRALDNAVLQRGYPEGVIVHSDCGTQFGSRKFRSALKRHGLHGSMGRWARAGTMPRWNRSSTCYRKTFSAGSPGQANRSCASRSCHGTRGRVTASDDNAA